MSELHSINAKQRLYVLPSGDGYSCLGFDVAGKRRLAYLKWLGIEPGADVEIGTAAAFNAYQAALSLVLDRCRTTGKRCDVELEPRLTGLEGNRVEVTAPDGYKSRFYVGKSIGPIPIHLEIRTRASSGGSAAYIPQDATVRVVDGRR